MNREKTELLSQLDELEENNSDVMRKYSALVKQQTTGQKLMQEQSLQIEEMLSQQQQLRETIATLESRIQHLQVRTFKITATTCISSCDVTFIVIFLQDTFVEKESVTRLDSKIRDLESRLELEEVSRQRADVRRTQLIKTSTVDYFSYVFFNFCRCSCCCCSFSRLAPKSSWRV